MRLTRKNEFAKQTGMTHINNKPIYLDEKNFNESLDAFREITNKLGQLEDIEDKLGIDLITLFKALTGPIYLYHNGKIIKCEQAPILLNFGEEDKKEYGFEFYFQDEQDVEQVYFKDYGKTWSLVKEELE